MIEGEEDEMIERSLDDFIWLRERERLSLLGLGFF